MMQYAILVEEISCDRCGYRDRPDKFPEVPPEIWKRYAPFCVGIICPVCGNYSEFDFDPDAKIQRGCAKLVPVPS